MFPTGFKTVSREQYSHRTKRQIPTHLWAISLLMLQSNLWLCAGDKISQDTVENLHNVIPVENLQAILGDTLNSDEILLGEKALNISEQFSTRKHSKLHVEKWKYENGLVRTNIENEKDVKLNRNQKMSDQQKSNENNLKPLYVRTTTESKMDVKLHRNFNLEYKQKTSGDSNNNHNHYLKNNKNNGIIAEDKSSKSLRHNLQSINNRRALRRERKIARRSASSRPPAEGYKYAVVIDAGSTGSRARIYKWLPENSDATLPDIREVNNTKIVPGVSEYADDRSELERHVSQLIRKSEPHVPISERSRTPIYFMATAGMRMLLEDNAYTAIQLVQEILSNSTINPFWFGYTENARILSGEEEGVFAWIAVNYLSGVFKHNKGGGRRETYGILELGGASTQIAFVPRGNILADKFPILIGGVVYSLYVHSYLHYGQKYVDKWIKDQLCIAADCAGNPQQTVSNPCMLVEDEQTDDVGGHAIKFVGSGDPARCSQMLHILVYKAEQPWHCFPKPCAIGTSYQPTIQSSMTFYALGAFIHSMQTLNALSSDGSMTPSRTQEAAFEFCQRRMTSMALYRPGRRNFLSTECLMGLYIPILFTKGYGFNNDSSQIRVVRGIDNHPIEWTLGAILYENERRSCKHCPVGPPKEPCSDPVAHSKQLSSDPVGPPKQASSTMSGSEPGPLGYKSNTQTVLLLLACCLLSTLVSSNLCLLNDDSIRYKLHNLHLH